MKEAEPNDPMELVFETIPGEAAFLAQCVIEEFASIGYGAEDLFTLFREPIYPMLNDILRKEGEPFVRGLIEQVLAEWGTLKVKTEIIEGGNELEEVQELPSSDEEGWLRHQENTAKPPFEGADGVVLIKRLRRQSLLERTTPSAPIKVPSGHLLGGAATPPLPRRGICLTSNSFTLPERRYRKRR